MDIFSYSFVWLAAICALILAGIHAYLGFHIVSRGVIFVDLSLAQMAALGHVVAALIGIPEGTPMHYGLSLSSTFLGAWIVSIAHDRRGRIPQEAFIGILYAASAALSILFLVPQPGGMDELQHLLAGSILTVSGKEIVALAIVYAAIGVMHFFFRHRFFAITDDRASAVRRGWSVRAWDFAFYAMFAIVVTSSVAVAGVLLVFSLLVIPPVIALYFSSHKVRRLLVGWLMAALGAIGGIVFSVTADLPAGPSIITVLVSLLVVVAVIRKGQTAGD